MKTTLIATGILALGVAHVWGQGTDLFKACATSMGKDYVKARDQFLAARPDAALLKARLESKDWKERATARALLGWLAQEKMYRDLLASPKAVSLTGRENYLWLRDPSMVKAEHAALCLELLLKESDTANSAMDAAEVLVTLAQQKVELDVSLFHDCLRDAKFTNSVVRIGAARVLSGLPTKTLKSGEVLTTLLAVLKREAPEEAVVRSLLQALTASAADLGTKERDALAKSLQENPQLTAVLGKVEAAKAVGNIGGDVAAQVAVDILEKADNNIDKHWALEALAQSGSDLAVRHLKKYAKDAKAPETLKAAAVKGLGETNFDEEALNILVDNFSKGDDLMKLRVFKSLDTFTTRNLANPKAGDAIQGALFDMGKSKDNLSPRVRRVFEETVQIIERRLKKN